VAGAIAYNATAPVSRAGAVAKTIAQIARGAKIIAEAHSQVLLALEQLSIRLSKTLPGPNEMLYRLPELFLSIERLAMQPIKTQSVLR